MNLLKPKTINISKSFLHQSDGEVKKQMKKYIDGRFPFCWGYVGVNKIGKSAKARQAAEWYRESHPKNLNIAHDPQHQFRSIADYFIHPDDDMWVEKLLPLSNCLVILDELRMIHEQPSPMKGMREFLSMKSDRNVDIIWIVHSPLSVLNIMADYTTRYHIFLTMAQEGSFDRKIPNSHYCITASNYVNNYVARKGRGEYPNFPYMVVDIEKQSINGYNMDATAFENI